MKLYTANRLQKSTFALILSLGLALTGGGVSAASVPSGAVSQNPATFTPHLGSANSNVQQLTPCGPNLYAAGSFSSIVDSHDRSFGRSNVFAFNATTGAVTSFSPNVNGTVNSIALSSNCQFAYLGGRFTQVSGTKVSNLAEVNVATGAVVTGFAHTAAGQVSTLLVHGSHLIAGGYFTNINASGKAYMASLNLNTGKDDGYINLGISGNYNYTDANGNHSSANATRVYNLALSPSGNKLLAMGDFTTVAGQGRRQIFMLDLGSNQATLDNWYSTEFNANCATVEPYYVQDAAWSPNGATIYVATTGYKPATGAGFSTSSARAGLCDAEAAFPSTSQNVSHKFINYTGCDSLYATAADTNIVYMGGHERWANNPKQCDNNNNGSAVSMPGIGGLSTTTGLATAWNPTRGRGHGADDMVLTSAGLWVASDNFFGSTSCGHDGLNHGGICFLPR